MQVDSGENTHISDKVGHELGGIHADSLLSHKQIEEIQLDYCANTSHPFVLEEKRKWR